jgi:DNA-binding beta-propeller fold protein YncE
VKAVLASLLALAAPAQSGWVQEASWPPVPSTVRFYRPASVAVDAQGRILIFHRGQPPLLRFERDGRLQQAWGEGLFQMPHGLKIAPDGTIWVTDSRRNMIVQYSPEGRQLRVLGVPDHSGAGPDRFDGVADLAFSPNGDFYVADGYRNSRVVKFSRDGEYLFEWGKKGAGPGEFNLVHAVALDSKGRVFVADRENARIQIFDPNGKYITEWRHGKPFGLAVTVQDEVWMTDARADRILKLSAQGEIVDSIDPPVKHPPAEGPHMLAIDRDGGILVTETSRTIVREFVRR